MCCGTLRAAFPTFWKVNSRLPEKNTPVPVMEQAFVYFFHVLRDIRTRIGKISSLPASMATERMIVEKSL